MTTGEELLAIAAAIREPVKALDVAFSKPKLAFHEVLDPRIPDRLAAAAHRLGKFVMSAEGKVPSLMAEDLFTALCAVHSQADVWRMNLLRWRAISSGLVEKVRYGPVAHLVTTPYLADIPTILRAAATVDIAGKTLIEGKPVPSLPDPNDPKSGWIGRRLVADAYLGIGRLGKPADKKKLPHVGKAAIPPSEFVGQPIQYVDAAIEMWGDTGSPLLLVMARDVHVMKRGKKKGKKHISIQWPFIVIRANGKIDKVEVPMAVPYQNYEELGKHYIGPGLSGHAAAHLATMAERLRKAEI